MNTMKFVKRSWYGPWMVGVLCILVLVATTPPEARASVIQIPPGIFNALDAISNNHVGVAVSGFVVVLRQLEIAVNDAVLANSNDDPQQLNSDLSKAIGAAEALMGMTVSCDTCDDLRSTLQQLIGALALSKSQVLGVVETCNPNGVIQGNEQCDPLAVPNGCPVAIVPTFCNADCQCVPIIP